MGPRLISRGKKILDGETFVSRRASMGPRLISRGKSFMNNRREESL